MKIFIRPDLTITGEREATVQEFYKFLRGFKSRVFIKQEKREEVYYLLETKVGDLLIARIEL